MTAPTSTYRLQLRPEFGFDDVARIAPYLSDLGISDVYLSPHFQSAQGSTHGYDIVDHSHVNTELGGPEAHARMCEALAEHGLRQIVDIVPNHMAIPGRDNAWWWDVLKNGVESRYSRFFDIDWDSVSDTGAQALLLPVLGERYGEVLKNGQLELRGDEDDVVVAYFDAEFPISNLTDVEFAELDEISADSHRLHTVLEKQHYRLAYWRLASDELEYRRFFDINTLMALRSEREDVFKLTHGLVSQWVHDNTISGVRVDHVDGLANPAQYLQRLRSLIGSNRYLAVEKILETSERLRPSWPIEGTTGYEALRLVDGLFIDPVNEKAMSDIYRRFTGDMSEWEDTVVGCKRLVVDDLFGSDVARLSTHLYAVCEWSTDARDFSRPQVVEVVKALLVHLSVYRTYVVPETGFIAEADEALLQEASSKAKNEVDPELHPLVDFVVDVLTLKREGFHEANFVRRFQQVSGPVMAKGVEDTAGYRYNRLVVLNEVGGSPNRFGVRPDEFHESAADVLRTWPSTMIAATTHDTKRSEDFRYRLALLSEIPEQWQTAVNKWSQINHKHRRPGSEGERWPDRATEYLLYQTMVGAHPIKQERVVEYMTKAVRENKLNTSWQNVNEEYESALRQFIAGIYSDSEFQSAFLDLTMPLIDAGRVTSLSALVLRMTMPGIPDLFQGSELWNLTLVDPDNRRPVDYEKRIRMLAEVQSQSAPPAINDSGAAKMFTLTKLLHLRQAQPEAFDHQGDYLPLTCEGERTANVVAYARGELVVVTPRLVVSLEGDWRDTAIELPAGEYKDIFTNQVFSAKVSLSELLSSFPVAVLAKSNERERIDG